MGVHALHRSNLHSTRDAKEASPTSKQKIITLGHLQSRCLFRVFSAVITLDRVGRTLGSEVGIHEIKDAIRINRNRNGIKGSKSRNSRLIDLGLLLYGRVASEPYEIKVRCLNLRIRPASLAKIGTILRGTKSHG